MARLFGLVNSKFTKKKSSTNSMKFTFGRTRYNYITDTADDGASFNYGN